jgi:hypothetical protein
VAKIHPIPKEQRRPCLAVLYPSLTILERKMEDERAKVSLFLKLVERQDADPDK